MLYGRGFDVEARLSHANDGALVIEVEDHGIGIAAEDQARIFNRFERAVATKDFGGLGLGLYIVKSIVEAHEGRVELRSDVGQGTTFRVILPADRPGPPL